MNILYFGEIALCRRNIMSLILSFQYPCTLGILHLHSLRSSILEKCSVHKSIPGLFLNNVGKLHNLKLPYLSLIHI